MKKIAIMLLAALMLFAFVACDDTTKTDGATLKVSALAEGDEYLEKTAADYGDYTITDGKVEGTLYLIENFTEFNATVEEEQSGYYLAFKLTDYEDLKDGKMTFYKDGTATKKDIKVDEFNVFRVEDAEAETPDFATWKVSVTSGDETYSVTFDLSKVELGTKPAAETQG